MKNIIESLAVYNPVSIFLYWSRARWDYIWSSDYEIGVIFNDDTYVHSNILKQWLPKDYSVYPFKLSDIQAWTIDTPFQKSIYLNDVKISSKVLYGEDIFSSVIIPSITLIDLLQDISFQLGYGLWGLWAVREWNEDMADYLFYKSCLYATRTLILLKTWIFASRCGELHELSKTIDVWEFREVVEYAFAMRAGTVKHNSKFIFKNFSYLNTFIEVEIKKSLEEWWDRVIFTL
jgi:hypothetical protein